MVSNYSSAVSKTICIDLLNLSLEELQNLSFVNPIINTFFSYLFHNHKALHNDPLNKNLPHLIYMEEDFIIGSRRHAQSYQNFSLGGYEILSEDKPLINSKLFQVIETNMIKNKSLYSNSLSDVCFKEIFKNNETENFTLSFFNRYIKVSNQLALDPIEVKKQYNITSVFLDTKIENLTLKLSKIYYKNQIPLVFIYSDEDNQNYMSWNKDYLVLLERISPINSKIVDNESILNTILDKINSVGIKNLKSSELAFLNYYSNL